MPKTWVGADTVMRLDRRLQHRLPPAMALVKIRRPALWQFISIARGVAANVQSKFLFMKVM